MNISGPTPAEPSVARETPFRTFDPAALHEMSRARAAAPPELSQDQPTASRSVVNDVLSRHVEDIQALPRSKNDSDLKAIISGISDGTLYADDAAAAAILLLLDARNPSVRQSEQQSLVEQNTVVPSNVRPALLAKLKELNNSQLVSLSQSDKTMALNFITDGMKDGTLHGNKAALITLIRLVDAGARQ